METKIFRSTAAAMIAVAAFILCHSAHASTRSTAGTPWEALQAQLDEGGTVTLTNDVTAADGDAMLTVSNAVTLDLNGHVIDAAGYFGVIQIFDGGNLTLTNSVEGVGTITGGFADLGGGVYVDYECAFTMSGGTISGNTASVGGGVGVGWGGVFTMSGGTISGNAAGDEGGGVYMRDGTFTVSGSPVVSDNTNSVGAAKNAYLEDGCAITVSNLTAGAHIGVKTQTAPTLSNPVTFATDASAGDVACFFSDIFGYDVELDGSDLQLVPIMAFPTYLDGADNSVRSKYVSWAARNGEDLNSAHEAAFLLNVAPSATPTELRIDGIEVGSTGATIRVGATAGGEAVDLSQINGILAVATGDAPASLKPKAIPATNVSYTAGAATVFVPSSAGAFVQARIIVATPASSL